ncbi:MAG: citrate/2-methylcitrate synthase, partial [Actinomycetota bacterium]
MSTSDTLTAAEVAEILGVKRQTIYAYVSRGILHRQVAMDGRTSLFDRAEVEEIRLGRRSTHEGELRTILSTGLTNVTDEGLTIRGQNVVDLVAGGAGFVDLVELTLGTPDGERWPAGGQDEAGDGIGPGRGELLPAALDTTDAGSLLEQLRILVAVAASSDPLRDDLDPRAVRTAGRRIIDTMVAGLRHRPVVSEASPIEPGPGRHAAQLWDRLTDQPVAPARLRAVDAALALLVDHGLATSTVAARLAASVRADPFSVVLSGLGVVGGPLHGRASVAVHELYLAAAERGPGAALGALTRQGRPAPGLGHAVYRTQDPRYGALMELIVAAWGGDARLGVVFEVRDLLAARSDRIPNIDLALGALTYLAGMPSAAG